MNILYTETLKKWGGQQSRVLQEAAGLTRKGHNVIIACNKKSILAQKSKEEGIKIYELNMTKKTYPITIPRLISIILRDKVDIVCTNSSVDSWAGGIAALLTKRILVRFKHNLYRIKKDPPTRFIYSLPHRFIAVSNTASEEILRTGYIKSGKVEKVFGAIDPEKFNPESFSKEDKKKLRISLGIPENALVIGNTSGFTRVKGQHYLLKTANELFKKRNSIFLLILGGRREKEKAVELVEPEFRSRVILPGYRTDIPLFLSIMDIFVFPSTVEAFGYSLIEAMAMAKAVVVSDIPSFRESIANEINGVFFKSADSGSLLNILNKVIESPEKWQILGDNARRTVLEKFIPDRMFKETENIYLNLLNKDNY